MSEASAYDTPDGRRLPIEALRGGLAAGRILSVLLYLAILAIANMLMMTQEWASNYLSIVIIATYLTFRPDRVLHPNNMVFAFYGMYVILSSTLNFILYLIDWEYQLPWGALVHWDTISRYTLFQAEFTFLVLYFTIHFSIAKPVNLATGTSERGEVSTPLVVAAYFTTFLFVVWFVEVTGGLEAWINDYSFTFLTKREGHGLLNVVTITLGNATVYLLGLKLYFSKRKLSILLAAVALIFALAFINGIKSRLIFLLLLLVSPYLLRMNMRLRSVIGFGVVFFTLLYAGTYIRTGGFYASPVFFMEMMVGYFNSFQIHDYVVTSRDSGFLQTLFQVFVKPMQILGLRDPNDSYDISVMLTKEFFPDQWEKERATQQWPLDTELYLNFYGPYLSWLPTIIYGAVIAWLYKMVAVRQNLLLAPIYVLEFQRMFSTLRGSLLPWDIFIFIPQYVLIFLICRAAINMRPVVVLGGRQDGVTGAGARA